MSEAATRFRVTVLGPTGLERDGLPVPLSPRQRGVLAAIVLDRPRPVGLERIVDLLWRTDPPATARQSVLNQLSRIRARAPGVIVRIGNGYGLDADVEVEDPPVLVAELDRDLDDAERLFADLGDHPEAQERRHRALDTMLIIRTAACEDLLSTDPERAAAVARELVERSPYHEGVWWVLAMAEARSGRRRDALAVIERARTLLTEVGLEAGERLRALERAVLDDTIERSPADALGTHDPGALAPRGTQPVGIDHLVHAEVGHIATGASGATIVAGPAGAGKSVVLSAVVSEAWARGVTTFSVSCDPEASIPLQPVVDLVRLIAERHAVALAPIRDRDALATLVPRHAEARGGIIDRRRILDVVATVLHHLPGPTIVTVEDVHWAPPRTTEAILRLVEVARDSPVPLRVVVSARDDDAAVLERYESVGCEVLRLPRWSAVEIDTYLAPTEPDHERRTAAARWLATETGGLPMFVRELTLHLVRAEALGVAARGDFVPPDDVPNEISTALAARVARLGPDAAHALAVAAILGPDSTLTVLRGVPTVRVDGINELIRRGMLVRDGSVLRFDHELLRRAVLERLGPATTAELHDLARSAYDDHPGPSAASDVADLAMERARHALGAASLDPERAVRDATEAGHEALRRSAREAAATWWLDAADVLDGVDDRRTERCRLRIAAGEQLLHAGDGRARDLLFRIVHEAEALGDDEIAAAAATVVCRLGPTSEAGMADPEAAEVCERLLARLSDPGQRALLGAAATMVHSLAGRSDHCRAVFDSALADAALANDDDVWAHVLPYAYQTLPLSTDVTRREVLASKLLEVAARTDRADARWAGLHLRFADRMMLGDPSVRTIAREVAAVTTLVREQSRDWELHYVRAALAHLDGDHDRSERIIADSLSYADTVAASRVMAVYGVQLLAIRMDQGRLAELLEPIAGLCESQPAVGAWRAAHALTAVQAGETEAAARSFDLAIARDAALLDRDQTFVAAAIALGEAAIAFRDADRCRAVLPLLEPFAGTWSWTGSCTLGPVDTTLAGLYRSLGDMRRADAAAEAAVDAARRMSAPHFLRHARTRQESP